MRKSSNSIAGMSGSLVAKLAIAAALSLSLAGCMGYDLSLIHISEPTRPY